MLTLSRRNCYLGTDYSGKVVAEDGRVIRTLVYQLENVMLEERELNALLGEPHAWSSLYNSSPDGPVPFLKGFKSMELDKPIETANVKVYYGLDVVMMQEFVGVTLSKIKLALLDGGITAMSCKVRTAPTLDETLAQLFEHFGEPIESEIILLPPNSQRELPLNTHGLGETDIDPSKVKRVTKSRGRGKGRAGAILQ